MHINVCTTKKQSAVTRGVARGVQGKGERGNVLEKSNARMIDMVRTTLNASMAEHISEDRDVVLVVDDEEMIGEMIGNIVERHGCQYVSFSDPTAALQYYKENSLEVNLMIADLTMPQLPGPDLIKRALQINPKLPIILMTGYTGEQIPEDVRPLVCRVLPKPFVKAELLNAVRTALNKS
jgi:CheY-like chemotaxis protein